jgi:PAS domain S-box-containing protein
MRCNAPNLNGSHIQLLDDAAALDEWTALEALFDEPAAIAIVCGPEHVHERCNRAYCMLVGRSLEELLGRSVREALPQWEPQGFRAELDRVSASGRSFVAKALPAQIDRKGDGKQERARFNWVFKSLPSAERADRILIVASDVTAHVRDRERAAPLPAIGAKANAATELAHARLEGLNDLAVALSAAVTTDDVAHVVVDQGMRQARADIATLYVLDEAEQGLDLLAARGVAPEILSRIVRITEDEGNPRVLRTLTTGESVWAETEREYALLFPEVARASATGPRAKALWSVPLIVEGRPVGLLGMGFYSEQHFSPDDRRFVETFAKQCAQALQRALRRNRELLARRWLATTLQSIGDAVIATDNTGQITFMNGVAERLTGFREAEAHGRPLAEVFAIFSESTREPAESPVTKVLREGSVVGLANHTILRAKSGVEIPIDDSGAPIRDASGQIFGVVLVFRDVTIGKRAEKRRAFLARAMEAMVSSLDYRLTLTRVAELIVPELADWCTVNIMEHEHAVARQIAVAHVDPAKVAFAQEFVQRYPPDPKAQTGVSQVMRSGKSELYTEIPMALIEASAKDEHHLRVLRELKLESAMIVALRSEGGRTLGALTFVYADSGRRYTEEDLTFAEDFARRAALAIENAQAVAEVEAARAREQSLREQSELASLAKDQFLATVSHELRTPLNVILGWAVVLREREAPPDFQRALEVIERNARAQARLIEDVLDVSRIVSGKLSLSLAAVNVGDALRSVALGMQPAAAAKGIALAVSGSADERALTITADADRLQQILWNLLANSLKFTPKAGTISVSAERVGSEVQITVSDTGEGIRQDALPYVFEPFRQADSSTTRRHGGLGLGLALVKQIAAAHGGTVEASSMGAGRGASFVVRLPARATTEAVSRSGAKEAAIPRMSGSSPNRLQGLSVLVVDDEPDARELISEAFEAAGALVHQAASAADALREIERNCPTVLVSDIGMPHEDGYALARKVRALPCARGGDIPAVALTAYARESDVQRAFDAGYQRHVSKPVDPFELVEVVAQLAGRNG